MILTVSERVDGDKDMSNICLDEVSEFHRPWRLIPVVERT